MAKKIVSRVMWTLVFIAAVIGYCAILINEDPALRDPILGFATKTAITIAPPLLIALVVFLVFKVYELVYFHSAKFMAIKDRISAHIQDCNDLNDHIEELKDTHIGTDMTDRGHSDYHDNSKWNFKRSGFQKITNAPNVYPCSRTVCNNSRKDPMKYICRYFGFIADEPTLSQFENMLNNFTAVEDGKNSLTSEKDEILASISSDVPFLIRKLSKKSLAKNLGFKDIDLSDTYYPTFTFQYVSPGGNASTENTIVMDIPNLNAMVNYLSGRIKWKKSVAGQRALMTSALRKHILERDNYTCRQCGISTYAEPHLLLEVDHIIPVSKGGMTTEDNLQTLCWRCNRTKGATINV